MDTPDDRYDASTYGDRIADVYDDLYAGSPALSAVEATVSFLSSIAGVAPALELGIGTGRVALPLASAGVPVRGIDASREMVERLRAKPGGADIPVTIGSFDRFDLDARFSLIYVVFNTFFGLRSQEEQVSGFRSVARHLAPGGAFAMEAFVPDPARFDRGQRVSAISVESDSVSLEVSKHDPVEQTSVTQHVVIREDSIHLYPVHIRFAYVAELDLMARIAGLRLRERWADWDRSTFNSGSAKHISVWESDGGA
jgi:SAM-dependent methyltransferase